MASAVPQRSETSMEPMPDHPPATLHVNRRLRIPLSEFTITYARSSGPGGQNVNKVNSKAVLRWPVAESPSIPEEIRQRFLQKFGNRVTTGGDLVLSSERFRDQKRNVDDCLDRLRAMLLAVAVAPKPRRPTKPTKGSQRRRLEQKQVRSATKRLRRSPRASD